MLDDIAVERRARRLSCDASFLCGSRIEFMELENFIFILQRPDIVRQLVELSGLQMNNSPLSVP